MLTKLALNHCLPSRNQLISDVSKSMKHDSTIDNQLYTLEVRHWVMSDEGKRYLGGKKGGLMLVVLIRFPNNDKELLLNKS